MNTCAISSEYAMKTYSDKDVVTVKYSSTPAALANRPLGRKGDEQIEEMTYKEARNLPGHLWGVIIK